MKRSYLMVLFAVLFILSVSANAAELAGVEIHGFVSQGFMYSDHNNYLTADTEDGTFQFNELGINFSKDLTDNLRIGVQIFSRDLGRVGNNKVEIDWAYGDYHWKDWLGFRAGLMPMAHGLYNDERDLDMLRTFILLPQGVYPEIQRDYYTRIWGGEIYGQISLGKFGTIDYRGLIGTYSPDEDNSGVSAVYENLELPMDVDNYDVGTKYNGGIQWHTPLDGLKFGFTAWKAPDIGADLKTTVALGPLPAGLDVRIDADVSASVFSAEYIWEDLTIAAEYWLRDIDSSISLSGYTGETESEGWYGSISYRFTDWLEVGSYYSVYWHDKDDKDGDYYVENGEEDFRAWLKDLALTARIDINEYWLVKLEGHMMNGAADLLVLESDNPDGFEKDWYLFAAKVTFNF